MFNKKFKKYLQYQKGFVDHFNFVDHCKPSRFILCLFMGGIGDSKSTFNI